MYSPAADLEKLFADSANLAGLQNVQGALADHISTLRDALESSRKKDVAASHGCTSLNRDLQQVVQNVTDLSKRAQATGSSISHMTSDIQKLDRTKNNLIQSITVIKRLQMLASAYDQLDRLLARRQYRELAQTLPAVLELMSHFKSFRSISQIATLNKQVANFQPKVADQILQDFAATCAALNNSAVNHTQSGSAVSPENLMSACHVLENLQGDYKNQLLTWYCNAQMREYRGIFKNSDEAGSLENISRRYAYGKRLLKHHIQDFDKLFPPAWNVTGKLCLEFCSTTKQDLQVVLQAENKSITVQLLLEALTQTIDFETYVASKFKVEAATISTVFIPYLNMWIQHQDSILAAKFVHFKVPPRTSSTMPRDDGETVEEQGDVVLPSSAELFAYYRQALVQTTKLSKGPPLLDLANLYKKWLFRYCSEILRASLPVILSTDVDIESACIVINTADYSVTTIGQLEERIVSQLETDELKKMVSFDDVKSAFLEAINETISMLVTRVDISLEQSWREMQNINWDKLDSVGDTSPYVQEVKSSVYRITKQITSHLEKEIYHRMLCDRVVESTMQSFLNSMVRCRPISEVSAEQMLLDVHEIQMELLHLLKETASYSRHVANSGSRVEKILKVILTQNEPIEGLVQNYFYLIGDSSATNFKKILELKGIQPGDQAKFLEVFRSHVKAHDNLEEDSIIMKNVRINQPIQSNLSSNAHANGRLLKSPISESKGNRGPILTKDGFERGFEKIAQDVKMNKLNENFKSFGRLFRRDGAQSPNQFR